MMNFFNKIKSYGFWVSLSSALVMLATALGKAFGFEVENKIIEDIVMSIAGVLAVFGIVSMNSKKENSQNEGLDEDALNEDEIDEQEDDKNE